MYYETGISDTFNKVQSTALRIAVVLNTSELNISQIKGSILIDGLVNRMSPV
jgi:hypothetical protein